MICKNSHANFHNEILLENNYIGASTDEAWTEISIPEILKIPSLKPDIGNIQSVIITPRIEDERIISTLNSEKFDKQEGMRLTNKKLLIDGVLFQKIIYTSNEQEQGLVTIDFDIPFSTYIVIEPNTSINENKFYVNVYVEDVVVQMINTRNIFKNVTLFLKVIN